LYDYLISHAYYMVCWSHPPWFITLTIRNCHWSFVFIFSKPNLVHSFRCLPMVAF
jgi:hypothetical protein